MNYQKAIEILWLFTMVIALTVTLIAFLALCIDQPEPILENGYHLGDDHFPKAKGSKIIYSYLAVDYYG
jgi:hypothetical protein